MKAINSSEHWITEPKKLGDGSIVAYGISSWDMQGGLLRREMRRRSVFSDIKSMMRWANKYGIDATKEISIWQTLQKTPTP